MRARTPLAVLPLLLAAHLATAHLSHVHEAHVHVRLAHSQALPPPPPPPFETVSKGRDGETSSTQKIILAEGECMKTVTWDPLKQIGVYLVGTKVNVTMDRLLLPLPDIQIDPLSVVTITRTLPCPRIVVAYITWELDYVIPPLPQKSVSEGRDGDSSYTQKIILAKGDCFKTVTWEQRRHLGVDLVGTKVTVTMDEPFVPLPDIQIDPLSVVRFVRGFPCDSSGVAYITWELDYVIPPLPHESVSKGRDGDTSYTQKIILAKDDCFKTVTWEQRKHLGFNLVGTKVNVTMNEHFVPLPDIQIDPLSVVRFVRGFPCDSSGVAYITWELDYVITSTALPKVLPHHALPPPNARQSGLIPLPHESVSKGRDGDTSYTQKIILAKDDCFKTVTWEQLNIGVHLVGTKVNVTMDRPFDLLPYIEIKPLSVVNFVRLIPCANSGVAYITWELDYVIPTTTTVLPKVLPHDTLPPPNARQSGLTPPPLPHESVSKGQDGGSSETHKIILAKGDCYTTVTWELLNVEGVVLVGTKVNLTMDGYFDPLPYIQIDPLYMVTFVRQLPCDNSGVAYITWEVDWYYGLSSKALPKVQARNQAVAVGRQSGLTPLPYRRQAGLTPPPYVGQAGLTPPPFRRRPGLTPPNGSPVAVPKQIVTL